MPHFITKQDGLFYCYTLPVEQISKINQFLSVLEGSGVVDIIKNVDSKANFGRPGFDPYAMFATILYGFAVGSPTLRELENSCRYDLRFKYLMNEATPDHSSFSRFINQYIKPHSDEIFRCVVRAYLKRCGLMADECHIDGTKFEAKSNKYKVVWKPITYHLKLSEKIRNLLSELGLSDSIPADGIIPAHLIAAKLQAASAIPATTLEDREILSNQIQTLTNYLSKSLEYEEKERICGPDRNSFYKTDHDATAMCLKEDYYSGLGSNLRAAYQMQIVVSHGFVVAYYISQDRTDMHTFIPTLRRFYELWGRFPKRVTADAGYGCLENYQFCQDNGIEGYIKYPAWQGESSGCRPALYELNENETITCIAGRTGFKVEQPQQKPRCKGNIFFEVHCMNKCPFKLYCRRLLKVKTGRTRVFELNPGYQQLKQQARDRLLSAKGIEMRVNRSCQVEGVFGISKYDMGYSRIRRVGMNRVTAEFMLTALGLNTRKLFRFFEGKNPFSYWQAPEDLQPEKFKKPSAKRLANRIRAAKNRVKQPNEIARNSYKRKRRK